MKYRNLTRVLLLILSLGSFSGLKAQDDLPTYRETFSLRNKNFLMTFRILNKNTFELAVNNPSVTAAYEKIYSLDTAYFRSLILKNVYLGGIVSADSVEKRPEFAVVNIKLFRHVNEFIMEETNRHEHEEWGMDNKELTELKFRKREVDAALEKWMDAKALKRNQSRMLINDPQKVKDLRGTLKKITELENAGLNSGKSTTITSNPAQANTSARFEKKEIKKLVRYARRTKNSSIKKFTSFKRRAAKPYLYLSGTALSFLNKNLNNDSLKSNVLSLGVHALQADLFEFDADITFSQNNDLISGSDRSLFGSTILVPGIRKFSLLTDYRIMSIFKKSNSPMLRNVGSSISFNVTQLLWQWKGIDSLIVNEDQPVKVVPLAVDLLANINLFFRDKNKVNLEGVTGSYSAKISTDIGLAYRGIYGNVTHSDQLMKKFLGTSKQHYYGVLLGLNIKIERISIFFNGVIIGSRANNKNVPGLTGGQIISNLGFRADLYKLNGN